MSFTEAVLIIEATAALLTLIWMVLAGGRWVGRITAKLEDICRKLDKLYETDAKQWEQISEHGERIARVEG